MIFQKLYSVGDRLEDKVRGKLSHYPIVYAFIGGTGIIIFWRGVWHTVDYLMELFFSVEYGETITSWSNLPWWDGPLSILIGAILLLTVGLFVTSFIGNEIIISGLRREKRTAEKTEKEIEEEFKEDDATNLEIHDMNDRLKRIEKLLEKREC